MLKVFLHNGPLSTASPFNQLGRLDIAYEKLDIHADYKAVLSVTGVGEHPPVLLEGYPRWTASVWDLVMRATAMCLRQEEVFPGLEMTRKGAFAQHLCAIVQHWPDGYSPRCSCTMRTARSRTSGENLFDFLLMAQSSQRVEPPQNPGRFIACKRCNMEYKKNRTDFIVNLENAALLTDSANYRFIHPNFDHYREHISRCSQQLDDAVLVKYTVVAGSSKGAYTRDFFNLTGLEVNSFDNAQAMNPPEQLGEAALEVRALADEFGQ